MNRCDQTVANTNPNPKPLYDNPKTKPKKMFEILGYNIYRTTFAWLYSR